MARDPYPRHGPRRLWYRPWEVVCRCGLDAYPCIVVLMMERAEAARRLQEAATARRVQEFNANRRQRLVPTTVVLDTGSAR